VETSIGTLRFFDGVPSKETADLDYEHLDTMRAAGHCGLHEETNRSGYINAGIYTRSRSESGLTFTDMPYYCLRYC